MKKVSDRCCRRMWLVSFFILHSSFFIHSANAQTFTDDLRADKPGQGKVTVTQSKEIDELVNGTVATTPSTTATPSTPVAQNTPSAPRDTTQTEEHKPDSTKKQPIIIEEGDETVPPDLRKKVMRRSFKMQGYRVQVYSGGNSRADRQKAETAGAVMKSHFPDQPIYTHFYSPSWKCRMGNYKTQAEAQAYLARVRKLGYRQACIVKGPIQVQY